MPVLAVNVPGPFGTTHRHPASDDRQEFPWIHPRRAVVRGAFVDCRAWNAYNGLELLPFEGLGKGH